MAFLENLGKRVGEAAQAAAKKSSELVEITKLNVSINSEEDKIQKLYTQIGKTIFEKFKSEGSIDPDVSESCQAIIGHEQNIKALKEKIAEIKGLKACINCGTEMEKNQIYCSKCGAKNEPAPSTSPEPEAAETSQQAPLKCPSCNTELSPGAIFCTNCGTKVG